MKKYEMKFYLINGEVSHLVETKSPIRAKDYIKYQFEDKSKVLDLADGLVIVKVNVQYFVLKECVS